MEPPPWGGRHREEWLGHQSGTEVNPGTRGTRPRSTGPPPPHTRRPCLFLHTSGSHPLLGLPSLHTPSPGSCSSIPLGWHHLLQLYLPFQVDSTSEAGTTLSFSILALSVYTDLLQGKGGKRRDNRRPSPAG